MKWPASVVATGSVVAAVAVVAMMVPAREAVGVVGVLFATSERIADPQPHPAVRHASEGSIPLLLRRSGVVMAAF